MAALACRARCTFHQFGGAQAMSRKFQRADLEDGIIRASVWECDDHSRCSVYIPVDTPGYPHGKVIRGGNYGAVFPTFAEALQYAKDGINAEKTD